MAWVKIDKKIIDSYCFSNPISLKIWVWMLVKANYKKSFASLKIGKGYTTIEVDRGQLLFGRHRAESELNIDGSTICRHLKRFEELGQINVVPNNQYSVITICKYNDYQSINDEDEQPTNNQRTTNEQPTNNQRTSGEHQVNTSKEVLKKNKEDKELNIAFDIFWDLYDKKVGDKDKLEKKWIALKSEERQKAIKHIPLYKEAQPDKKFRKDPSTYLNNKSFNDEIIGSELVVYQENKNEPQKEYWEVHYGHLAKTKEEFMQLVFDGKIEY